MKERIYRVLNIKISESSQVFDLLIVQFFIGLANAFVNIIAFSLFIYHFPIDALPGVYLAISGVLLVVNVLYQQLEHRVAPLPLLRYIMIGAGILLLAMWIGLTFFSMNDFIYLLLISGVVLYMLTGYAFWGMVSLLFNVRESRRVFSIVGAGDIPAKLLGYLAGPLLIPFMGIQNILWLSMASLATGIYLFTRFTRKPTWDTLRNRSAHSHDHTPVQQQSLLKSSIISFLFKHKLIFAISLLSILSYNVFVLIDYTFVSQVKIRFENVADLATYIAIFFAMGRLVALAFKLIFTSRVIERLGIISCLFITPICLFAFCVLFLLYGSNAYYNIFIFGVMAMLTEVLRSTMQEPVFFILFQPLKEQLRLKGHLISKGYMYPPALFIVGISLMIMINSGLHFDIMISVKVLLVNLVIWALIILYIKKTYLHTVHESIRKGVFSSEGMTVYDEQTIEILLAKTKSSVTREVVYALNLLENAGYPEWKELYREKMRPDQHPDVRSYALDRMFHRNELKPDYLEDMMSREEDPVFRDKLFAIRCQTDMPFLFSMSHNMDLQKYATRKMLIIHLMNQQEFNYLYKAGHALNELLFSDDPQEKELAIDIISEIKHVQFVEALRELITDKEQSVRRHAVMAVCKLRLQPMLPDILGMTIHHRDRYLVLKGLYSYGDELFDHLRSVPHDIVKDNLDDLVKISGLVKGPHAIQFLLSLLHNGDGLEKKIVHSLWVKEYQAATADERQVFNTLLLDMLRAGKDKIRDHHEISWFREREVVKGSMIREVESDLITALKICAILHKKTEVNRIVELMQMDRNEKIYNALEMLELVLPKKIAIELNSLFDFVLDPDNRKIKYPEKPIAQFFTKVVFNETHLYNPWTKAVCVYYSWKQNQTELLTRLRSVNRAHEPFIIRETSEYVLNTINTE